jgi:hypothetical protein
MPGSSNVERRGSSATTANRGQKRRRQFSPEQQESYKRTKLRLNIRRRPPVRSSWHRRRAKFALPSPLPASLLEGGSHVVASAPQGKSGTAFLDKPPHTSVNDPSDEEGLCASVAPSSDEEKSVEMALLQGCQRTTDNEDEAFTKDDFWGDYDSDAGVISSKRTKHSPFSVP